jgi:hypothetical protein
MAQKMNDLLTVTVPQIAMVQAAQCTGVIALKLTISFLIVV